MKEKRFNVDLQVHPLGKIRILDILRQMEKNNLDLVALLNYSWHDSVNLKRVMEIDKEVKRYYKVDTDGDIYCFENSESKKKLFVILGSEVTPLDRSWHFLSIGKILIEDFKTPEEIIDKILEVGAIPIFDHPFADTFAKNRFRDIRPEKEDKFYEICTKYMGEICLEWNGPSIPWIRKIVPGYSDINKKISEAQNILISELGKFVPLVATGDIHAWNKRLLKWIGISRIEILGEVNENDILSYLKKNIFRANYFNRLNYVSAIYFLEFVSHWLRGQ